MGHLIFRCPKTQKEFDSGFQAKPSDLNYLPAGATIRLRCRICNERHEFKFEDARIDEKD
jgi:hypothetical protein